MFRERESVGYRPYVPDIPLGLCSKFWDLLKYSLVPNTTTERPPKLLPVMVPRTEAALTTIYCSASLRAFLEAFSKIM